MLFLTGGVVKYPSWLKLPSLRKSSQKRRKQRREICAKNTAFWDKTAVRSLFPGLSPFGEWSAVSRRWPCGRQTKASDRV